MSFPLSVKLGHVFVSANVPLLRLTFSPDTPDGTVKKRKRAPYDASTRVKLPAHLRNLVEYAHHRKQVEVEKYVAEGADLVGRITQALCVSFPPSLYLSR